MARVREVARSGQDRTDFTEALALLVDYYRMAADFMDVRRTKVYASGLRDVPGTLVKRAALYATETRVFFPKVPELKQDAEYCRQKLLAQHPYEPCGYCTDLGAPGWRSLELDGVVRLRRCDCWHDWRERLSQLGVPPTPLMLSAPDLELERERARALAGQGDD